MPSSNGATAGLPGRGCPGPAGQPAGQGLLRGPRLRRPAAGHASTAAAPMRPRLTMTERHAPSCAWAPWPSSRTGSCWSGGATVPARDRGRCPAGGSKGARPWPRPSCGSCGRRPAWRASATDLVGWVERIGERLPLRDRRLSGHDHRRPRRPAATPPRRPGSRPVAELPLVDGLAEFLVSTGSCALRGSAGPLSLRGRGMRPRPTSSSSARPPSPPSGRLTSGAPASRPPPAPRQSDGCRRRSRSAAGPSRSGSGPGVVGRGPGPAPGRAAPRPDGRGGGGMATPSMAARAGIRPDC